MRVKVRHYKINCFGDREDLIESRRVNIVPYSDMYFSDYGFETWMARLRTYLFQDYTKSSIVKIEDELNKVLAYLYNISDVKEFETSFNHNLITKDCDYDKY